MVAGEDIPLPQSSVSRSARAEEDRQFKRESVSSLSAHRHGAAYAWAGTFGETNGRLPYIAAHPDGDRRVYYALGYGAKRNFP